MALRSAEVMSGLQWEAWDYVYVTAECVTSVLSVLGNSLVLLAIWRTRALRTVTNCFIGSLAAADVLVGFIVPPTTILPYLGLPTDFYGCILVNTVVVLITNVSILNLLAIALERFLAISDPFRYQRVMTVNTAMVVVAITWVVAILLGLIPMMGWHKDRKGFAMCFFTAVIDLRYMVYLIFFGLTIPSLCAMLLIYIYIYRVIRKHQQLMAPVLSISSPSERREASNEKRQVRGAKGLAYVIILFAVCWLPLHILNCITVFAPEKNAPYQLLLVTIVLSHANSLVNPFLFAFSNKDMKRAMRRLLSCECDESSSANRKRLSVGSAFTSRRATMITDTTFTLTTFNLDDNFSIDKDIVDSPVDFIADKRFPNNLIGVPNKSLGRQDQRLSDHSIKEPYDDLNVCDSENAKAQILISPTQSQNFPEHIDEDTSSSQSQAQYTCLLFLSSEQTPNTS